MKQSLLIKLLLISSQYERATCKLLNDFTIQYEDIFGNQLQDQSGIQTQIKEEVQISKFQEEIDADEFSSCGDREQEGKNIEKGQSKKKSNKSKSEEEQQQRMCRWKERWDMCINAFPLYQSLPKLNPSCCRMKKHFDHGGYEGVIAFEDFCVSNDNTYNKNLDRCEIQFDQIECGGKAEATFYTFDRNSNTSGQHQVQADQSYEKKENQTPYFLSVSPFVQNDSKIKVYNTQDCTKDFVEVDNYSGNDFNRKLKDVEIDTSFKVRSIWIEPNTFVALYEKDLYQGDAQAIVTQQNGQCFSDISFNIACAQIKPTQEYQLFVEEKGQQKGSEEDEDEDIKKSNEKSSAIGKK